MIIRMSPGASIEQLERVINRITQDYGLRCETIVSDTTVIGVKGIASVVDEGRILELPGVDRVIRITEKADEFRQTLQNALTVHATLVAQRQNEVMQSLTETSLAQSEQTKKISSWAAIFFAPSLVAGIYGMNFHNMPELDWSYGYAWGLGLMLVSAIGPFVVFKLRGWL